MKSIPFRVFIKKAACLVKRFIYLVKLRQFRKQLAVSLDTPKILVLMNEGIGNAIEATPLVQAIRIFWPKSQISIYPPSGDLFDDWCMIDKVITSYEALRDESYDHTFICSGCIPAENSSYELGQIHRVKCFLWKWFLKPEREYYLDMLRRLGYKYKTPPLYVSISKPKMEIPFSPLRICLVPAGKQDYNWRHKRWPYYSQLAGALLSKYNQAQICIIGGKDDEQKDDLAMSSRLIDLRGRLTFRESAWLLRHSQLAIGNDCGPMHIADAVHTPSLIIFGPTCELKNAPLYKAVPLYANVLCRPCQYSELLETCQNPRCMMDLTPEIVFEKVDSLIKDIEFCGK